MPLNGWVGYCREMSNCIKVILMPNDTEVHWIGIDVLFFQKTFCKRKMKFLQYLTFLFCADSNFQGNDFYDITLIPRFSYVFYILPLKCLVKAIM